MNRRFRTVLIVLAVGPLLSSCNNATPENYFDEAVLNVNLITLLAVKRRSTPWLTLRLNSCRERKIRPHR